MPKAMNVVRPTVLKRYGQILIKRDGHADLLVKRARLVLSVETAPISQSRHGASRWKVFHVYEIEPDYPDSLDSSKRGKAVVSEEGHSSREGEVVRYSAYVCDTGVQIWEAMGKIEELKPVLAEMNWAVVEEL